MQDTQDIQINLVPITETWCCVPIRFTYYLPTYTLKCSDVIELCKNNSTKPIYMILSDFKILPHYVLENIDTSRFVCNFYIYNNTYNTYGTYVVTLSRFIKYTDIMACYNVTQCDNNYAYVGFRFNIKNVFDIIN